MVSKILLFSLVVTLVSDLASAKTKWHQLGSYTFEDYEKEFMKVYASPAERTLRKALVTQRLIAINQHNADPTKTWKNGVNHLSDLTEAEFQLRLGYNKALGYAAHIPSNNLNTVSTAEDLKDIPVAVDWRKMKVVTDVKDQGNCGSCWSFAATETIESHYALQHNGVLSVLSEQNILSCVANPKQCGGTGGCNGGTAELAYEALQKTGITTEWMYPYTSYFGTNSTCVFGPSTRVAANITGYTKLSSNLYMPLMNAVAKKGPIAISVDASSWSAYEFGIFDGCDQAQPDIDHAVQLVGYGFDTGLNASYWLVRNSWSPTWGEDGYIRVMRTDSEQERCGTDITPGDGTGCANGPTQVDVCGTCGILFDSCFPLTV